MSRPNDENRSPCALDAFAGEGVPEFRTKETLQHAGNQQAQAQATRGYPGNPFKKTRE